MLFHTLLRNVLTPKLLQLINVLVASGYFIHYQV